MFRSDSRVCDGHVDCMNGEDEEEESCGMSAHSATGGQVMNQRFSALSGPAMDSEHFKASFFYIDMLFMSFFSALSFPHVHDVSRMVSKLRVSLETFSALPRNIF